MGRFFRTYRSLPTIKLDCPLKKYVWGENMLGYLFASSARGIAALLGVAADGSLCTES